MMRTATLLLVIALLCPAATTMAQPAPPAAVPVPPGGGAQKGMDPGAQILFELLADPDVDIVRILPLLMMMGGDEGDKNGDDGMGMLLLLKGISGGGPQPVLIRDGDTAFVVQGGVLQKVNVATMESEGRLDYKRAGQMGPEEIKKLLAPLLEGKGGAAGPEVLLKLMANPEVDMAQVLPLLIPLMAQAGGDGGDAMGLVVLTRLLSSSGAGQPVCQRDGDTLLILDESILYKVNVGTMELEDRLDCRKGAGKGPDKLMKILGPLLGQGEQKAP